MSATLTMAVRQKVTKKAGSFVRRLSAGFDAIARYLVCRSAIANLRELDDRALRDIGLERSQIEAAVCGLVTLSGPRTAPRTERCLRASTRETSSWN